MSAVPVCNMVAELLQGTEEEIYGDSGYLGAEKRDDAVLVNNEGKPIRYQINKRPSQLKKANGEKFELLKAIEHAKSSVRSKVEHVFCVIKRIFHFCTGTNARSYFMAFLQNALASSSSALGKI